MEDNKEGVIVLNPVTTQQKGCFPELVCSGASSLVAFRHVSAFSVQVSLLAWGVRLVDTHSHDNHEQQQHSEHTSQSDQILLL